VSAYVEVMIKGGCRAYLDAGSIMGILTSTADNGDSMATPDAPLTLILRSGDTLPDVYGVSPNRLLLHAAGAKMIVREEGRLLMVAYLDKHEELEARIAYHQSGRQGLG
jgi:hypothetical protein